MAKTTKRTIQTKAVDFEKISKIFGDGENGAYKNMVNAASNLPKESAQSVLQYMDNFNQNFGAIYKEYIHQFYDGDKKEANILFNRLNQLDNQLINQIMTVEYAYPVLEVAEKKGVKVNWQDMPVYVINDTKVMDFLKGKGYDFNAVQMHNGAKMDFTDYHLAFATHYEGETVQKYNQINEVIKRRDELLADFAKQNKEYNDPQTSAERKQVIYQNMLVANKEFLGIEKQIPIMYKETDKAMKGFFTHSGCLDYAVEKNLLTPENIEKFGLEKLHVSMGNMAARHERMEKIREFFIKDQQTNANGDKEHNIATAQSFRDVNDISGTLAALENPPAILKLPPEQEDQVAPSNLAIAKYAENAQVITEQQDNSDIMAINNAKGAQNI